MNESLGFYTLASRRFRKNKISLVALFFLVVLVVLATTIPLVVPHTEAMNIINADLSPNMRHWFGTDDLGRDLFYKIWQGVRISLLIAVICAIIQLFLGCLIGGIMALVGGVVDGFFMRIIEVLNSLPGMLLTMLIIIVLGNSICALLVALSCVAWCGTARQIRGLFLKLKNQEFIAASYMLGSSTTKIIFKHLIPNITSILILDLTTSIPGFIFGEAGLSFLGIGLKSPNVSLGVLLEIGRNQMTVHPYKMLIPSILLVIIVLTIYLVGDGLRDAFDVKGGGL
jgi:oligopeptide transport system permease protein